MRNSKTLEFMNNLNEKINKDNIEINKAIANPNLGKNQDRIKQAGYDIEYNGDMIKNPKTGKRIWPKDYSRDEKKKVDFKGKLDSNRENIRTTRRFAMDIEDNKIPKSARLNRNDYNSDEVDSYSPAFYDMPKKSISNNINYYKKAVKDRDEARDSAERNKKSLGYYEKKVKDAQKDLDFQKDYIKGKEKEADFAENKRKELMSKVRAKKTSTVKEGAEPIAKGLKKKLKESENKKESKLTEARQEEILSKLPKKKIEETDSNLPNITWILDEYNVDIVTKEELGSDYSYHTLVKNDREAEKFNYHSDHWGDEYTYQEEMIYFVGMIEGYVDKNVIIDTDDGPVTYKLLGVLIDKQYNSVSHAKILVEEIEQSNLKESEEAYEESEQQLNEETVGEKITSPSGKFWVGDPCYVLSDDVYYGIWDDKYHFEDGKIDVDDKLSFLVHGTAYGDGSYPGNGFDYGVDSGTLAVIPMDLVAKTDGVQFGTVETSNTAWLDYNDGTFDITLDDKSFSIETGDFEDDSDKWDNYEDEEEIEDYYDQENDD